MLPRIVAPVLLALVTLVAPTAAASADPYAPQIPTRTTITVVVGQEGDPIELALRVSANADRRPTGTLRVALSTAAPTAMGARAAAPIWDTTVQYDGGRLVVEGPVAREGGYVATAEFVPDGQVFLGSDDVTRFQVGDGSGPDGDDGGLDGILPDTGGPNMLWLLLGLALVGGGAGAVVYARRRETDAVASA